MWAPSKQGCRQGGLRWLQSPPPPKEKRERGEEERKKEEREKRNQKRKEVEPVIPRTCFHGPLVILRPLTVPGPLTIMASALRTSRQPPLSQNPAYAPAHITWKNTGLSKTAKPSYIWLFILLKHSRSPGTQDDFHPLTNGHAYSTHNMSYHFLQ